MARQPRIEFPGALFHVLARGNNKQKIFFDEQDYQTYLNRIKKYHRLHKFKLYAFVLMPNHIHLLLETGIIPLAKIMQGIQESYALFKHKKYKSVGHLYQSRYKPILCQEETYLLRLIRYIHLNPVRAGLSKTPEEYPWSSYRHYLGLLKLKFVDSEYILNMFSSSEFMARNLFHQFINESINNHKQEEFYQIVGQRFLGSEDFIKKAKEKNIKNKEGLEEEVLIPVLYNMNLSDLLDIIAKITNISQLSILGKSKEHMTSNARSLFVFVASRHTETTNKTIAACLNRSPGTVSHMIRRVEESLDSESINSKWYIKVIKLMQA